MFYIKSSICYKKDMYDSKSHQKMSTKKELPEYIDSRSYGIIYSTYEPFSLKINSTGFASMGDSDLITTA